MKREIAINTAEKINELHQGLTVLLHLGIEKAVEIGQLLSSKKAQLPYGNFGNWVKENLVFTDRTARNYMKLFENKEKVLQAGNISEAYKMLGEGKNENGNVSVLEKVNHYIEILELCSLYLEEDWKEGGPIYIPADNVGYDDDFKKYLAGCKKKTDLAFKEADIETISKIIKELKYIQNKMGVIECWGSRICGQIFKLLSNKEQKKFISEYGSTEIRLQKKLASISHEMFKGIISKN